MKSLSREEISAVYDQGREAVIALLVQFQARIEALERQIGQNSQDSSKPPSSDRYNEPSPKSLRRKSGRLRRRQAGLPGATLTIMPRAFSALRSQIYDQPTSLRSA